MSGQPLAPTRHWSGLLWITLDRGLKCLKALVGSYGFLWILMDFIFLLARRSTKVADKVHDKVWGGGPLLGLHAVTTLQGPETLMIIAVHAVTSRRNTRPRAVTLFHFRLRIADCRLGEAR